MVSLEQPWDSSVVTELRTGKTVPVTLRGKLLSWDTRAGESYGVAPAP